MSKKTIGKRKNWKPVPLIDKSKKKNKQVDFVLPDQILLKKPINNKYTLKQTFESIGFLNDPNKIQFENSNSNSNLNNKKIENEPFFDLTPKKKHKKHLSYVEFLHFKDLIEKYGSDYESMFRDIKLNYMQHTIGQLKIKCKLFHKLYKSSLSTYKNKSNNNQLNNDNSNNNQLNNDNNQPNNKNQLNNDNKNRKKSNKKSNSKSNNKSNKKINKKKINKKINKKNKSNKNKSKIKKKKITK
eukprot:TRINITY_DN83_c0_g1_i1.p1 TRINITY_DN83_c0_g1~~TRINITY_DN83_c0_g1_i1.p1  ORF type:complete len:253 (-),score=92.63 TRINITY_DN83_c0_g1_i1:48-773(-)